MSDPKSPWLFPSFSFFLFCLFLNLDSTSDYTVWVSNPANILSSNFSKKQELIPKNRRLFGEYKLSGSRICCVVDFLIDVLHLHYLVRQVGFLQFGRRFIGIVGGIKVVHRSCRNFKASASSVICLKPIFFVRLQSLNGKIRPWDLI